MEPITIETILAIFKNHTEKKRMKEIKDEVVKSLTPPDMLINPEQAAIEERVAQLIVEDKKLEDESWLKFSDGKYSKRRKKVIGGEVLQRTDFEGRAGECAVMSELIFRGYNANTMMVDEGVDVIAVKDNTYYFIQVKTTYMRNGRIRSQVDFDRFNQYKGAQIRYFIVVRYQDNKGDERNMFFQFTPEKLNDAIYQRCVKKSEDKVFIKIKFNEMTGSPILYDEREMDASYNLNRFEL